MIISINGVEITSWSGENNSISSELAKTIDGYDIVVERDGDLITLPTIYPTLNFIGLGFSGSAANSELVIDRPLYNVTELVAGDKIIAINDQSMTTWEDVIAFSEANKAGSIDKEDLFKITVFRQYKASVKGEIVSIDLVDGEYIIHLKPVEDSEVLLYAYFLKAEETLYVEESDIVEAGEVLGSGSNYDFEYVVYGEEVLNAMNAEFFNSRIGIGGTTKFSFFGGIANSFVLFWNAAASIFGTLGLLFTSDLIGISDLSGFVGIFSLTSQAAQAGIISLMSFIGLLSVNLGIINLLPIPALDGGKIVFIGYEIVTKRKPNQKVENWLHTIVFFLLIALMIYVTYNDILKLIGI